MLVFVTETDNDNIGSGNRIARSDGVQIGALVVMPELVRLGTQNSHTTIIACLMVGDRAGKTDTEPVRRRGDLVSPVSMDFAGQIDIQGHHQFSLLFEGMWNA